MRPFIFAGGIENTFINAKHPETQKRLEEYELIGHYENTFKDLKTVSEIGIDTLRWGIPWYRVHPEPGTFEWKYIDDVIEYLVHKLQVSPIIDLLHYGTPDWLQNSFWDDDFHKAYTEYVYEFCQRYNKSIRMATPVNEPWTTAEFCGRRGEWPPYGSDDSGFAKTMIILAKASIHASQMLHDHGIENVHVEVAGDHIGFDENAKISADQRNHEFSLYWDLITQRVNKDHPLFNWLLNKGVDNQELMEILEEPAVIDILGINFYPQWSVQVVSSGPDKRIKMQALQSDEKKLKELIRSYADTYERPVMITETSNYGPTWRKTDWLIKSIDVCLELRNDGVPMAGYAWFPLIDMIDWEYRNMPDEKDNYIIELGLWDIHRQARSTIEQYRKKIEKVRIHE